MGVNETSRRFTAVTLAIAATAVLLSWPLTGIGAAAAGQTETFALPGNAHASDLAAGQGGAVWFVGTDYAEDRTVVGWVTGDGGGGELASWPGGGPARIAVGAGGVLWITDANRARVGRVGLDGNVQWFALPRADSRPGEVSVGPDGSAWFVEEGTDRVGRVGANGSANEFQLPTGARPTGIATGADGGIWVAEHGRGRIARLTPAGAITEHSPPDPGVRPLAIVAGPGNALWFTDAAHPRLGRVTTGGEFEFLRVSSRLGTGELAVGGDGNLWFSSGNAIGSVSPEGRVGEPACLDASCRTPVAALTRSAAGELWFAAGLRPSGAQVSPAELYGPGRAGTFEAPPPRPRIGAGATRVAEGLTTIGLSCHGGAAGQACDGTLKLLARLPGRPGFSRLFATEYAMQPTSSRRLPLPLRARGLRALRRAKKLRVRVVATQAEGAPVRRGFVLRAKQ